MPKVTKQQITRQKNEARWFLVSVIAPIVLIILSVFALNPVFGDSLTELVAILAIANIFVMIAAIVIVQGYLKVVPVIAVLVSLSICFFFGVGLGLETVPF